MASPDPRASRAALTTRVVTSLLLIVAVTGGLYLLGATHPPKRSVISSDRLGPEGGTPVQTYLDDAAAGLARVGAGSRWALVSLRVPVTDDAAWALMAGTLQSRAAFHVPITGVGTPATFFAVTGDRRSLVTARANAIADIAGDQVAPVAGDESTNRAAQVSAVTISRLRTGCACIVAMVVRTTGERARAIAASPVVRGVEVLPADAGGRFGLSVLLPEQTDRVMPPDDTAPVPAR